MKVLIVENLTKKFGKFTAVDNVSFFLNKGEILGVLGPNGAGKTTTIQMLLGVLTPDEGNVFYFGKNLRDCRSEILENVNFSSTYTNLPWGLTVRENFNFISYLYDIKERKKRIDRIIDLFKIRELMKKQMRDLSTGQTTRVNLAKAFINYPKILLLDEPTASLDPDIAQYVREFLIAQKEKFKVSIILTSHNMAEVEEVCDRVLFLKEGKIIADDTPEQLARTIDVCKVSLLVGENREKLIAYCQEKNYFFKKEGNYTIVALKEKEVSNFLQALAQRKIDFSEVSINKPDLEDYFLHSAKKI